MLEHKMYCTLAAELSKDWSKVHMHYVMDVTSHVHLTYSTLFYGHIPTNMSRYASTTLVFIMFVI